VIELTERLIQTCLSSGASIRQQSIRRGINLAPDGSSTQTAMTHTGAALRYLHSSRPRDSRPTSFVRMYRHVSDCSQIQLGLIRPTSREIDMNRSWMVGLTGAALLVFVVGCAGGDVPNLAKDVTGRVTLNGQPVADAVVLFEPQSGRPSSGKTDADGRFVLYYSETHTGAVPGQHIVRVSKMEEEAGQELIPERYNFGSTLTETVTMDGPNDFTIEL